jgi:hypothetical protein
MTSAETASCPSCGSEVQAGMRYCGWCGAAIAGPRETVNVHTDRRLFGVPPATALLMVGALLVVLAFFFLITGDVLAGVVLLVVGLFVLSGFPELARRPGESGAARSAVRSYDGVRARAGATIDSLAIRAKARRRRGELDSDLEQLRLSRGQAISALGEAAYREEADDIARLRGEIASADAAIEAKESERRRVEAEVEEKVGETRSAAAATEIAPAEPHPVAEPRAAAEPPPPAADEQPPADKP